MSPGSTARSSTTWSRRISGTRCASGASSGSRCKGGACAPWVTAVDVAAPAGVTLKPIAMVSRGGLAPEVLDLARWASWRWAGRLVHLLDTASSATAARKPRCGRRTGRDGDARTAERAAPDLRERARGRRAAVVGVGIGAAVRRDRRPRRARRRSEGGARSRRGTHATSRSSALGARECRAC